MEAKFNIDYLRSALLIVVTGVFCVIIASFSLNLPRVASDDTKFFLEQFDTLYLSKSSFMERFQFLGEVVTWPHTKIIGRLMQIFQYYTIGEINFKYILYVGNLGFIFTLYLLYKASNKFPVSYLLIFAIWVFVPIRNNFWPIFICEFPYLLFFTLLTAYSFKIQHIWMSACCTLFMVFMHGHGFVVPFIAFGLYLLFGYFEKKKVDVKFLSIISVALILNLVLFYLFIWKSPMRLVHSSGDEISHFSIGRIFDVVFYVADFLFFSISRYFHLTSSSILLTLISIILILATLWSSFGIIKRYQYKFLPIICLNIYMIFSALMAGVMRGTATMDKVLNVSLRYEPWSMVFIATSLILMIANLKPNYRKTTINIVLAISFLFWIYRIHTNFNSYHKQNMSKIEFVSELLSIKKSINTRRISDALGSGLYNLPTEIFAKELDFTKESIKQCLSTNKVKIKILENKIVEDHQNIIFSAPLKFSNTHEMVFYNIDDDNEYKFFEPKAYRFLNMKSKNKINSVRKYLVVLENSNKKFGIISRANGGCNTIYKN